MMTLQSLSATERQLLEMLATGLPGREIADKMGLRDGTVRVYLHNLYRKLGVQGRHGAVVWLDKAKGRKAAAGIVSPAPTAAQRSRWGESFADMAMRTDLLAALGAMACFFGPHSRTWEISAQMQGQSPDARIVQRRDTSRGLWEAMLRGDWRYAKDAATDEFSQALLIDSPVDYAVLCAMLALGGYSKTVERCIALHEGKGKSVRLLKASESALIKWLMEQEMAALDRGQEKFDAFAKSFATNPSFRHLAMAAFFHLALRDKNATLARSMATTIWREVERLRMELIGMGDDVLAEGQSGRAAPAMPKLARPSTARKPLTVDA